MRARLLAVPAIATVLVLCASTAWAATVRAGDPLPSFDLVDLGGTQVTSAELAGTPAVVELWASWCAPCQATMRHVDALARAHQARGLRVLAVSIDQDRDTAMRFAGELLGPSPALRILHDPDQSLMSRLGVAGLPAVYVVDADGTVRFVTAGGKGEYLTELDRAVDDLLREREAPPTAP